MLRTVQSLPLERAFDTGLRPDPFPDRAASLLPGLLAATRTGLPPASDDELTTADQPPTRKPSCLLGARNPLTKHTALVTRASPPASGQRPGRLEGVQPQPDPPADALVCTVARRPRSDPTPSADSAG